ncbi:MAG: Uma2 family endonuclease [Myxococcales bacterium]|nr:Uma2 family endonuclease [Myxococcales bacterium]
MAQPALATPPAESAEPDQVVVLRGATWADYQRVLELRGERAAPRIAYLKGSLEIMSPSLAHESIKSVIGCLIEAWCVDKGIDITPCGSWTIERKEFERGAEPDECYVVGDCAMPERPDLAIEVVLSSGGIDKLELYRKLGVREVWFWRNGSLSLHVLRGDRYEAVANSEVLAGIDAEQLSRFVGVRPMTKAVRAYRAALRGE